MDMLSTFSPHNTRPHPLSLNPCSRYPSLAGMWTCSPMLAQQGSEGGWGKEWPTLMLGCLASVRERPC